MLTNRATLYLLGIQGGFSSTIRMSKVSIVVEKSQLRDNCELLGILLDMVNVGNSGSNDTCNDSSGRF